MSLDSFNLDELIPAEFRSIIEEEEKLESGASKDEPKPEPEPTSNSSIEPVVEDVPDVDIDKLDIDKLIKGEDIDEDDQSDSVDDDEEDDESSQFWHQDDKFKTIAEKLRTYGESTEELDALLQDVSDRKVLDTSKYTSDLKSRLEEIEKARDFEKAELERLKNIEKLAYFDSAKDTQEKYIVPLRGALDNIKKTLEFQGVGLDVEDLMKAKDRLSFNNILSGYDIDDDAKVTLYNNWKDYIELSSLYTEKRKEASLNLGNYLNTTISDDIKNSVMNTSLTEFVDSDEKLKYIREGLDKGIENNDEIKAIIANGRENFVNILDVLSDPSTHVHNREFLGKLAKFMWNNAHTNHVANKYYKLQQTYEKRDQDFKKLVKAYKDLAKSAGGIPSISGGSFPRGESKDSMESAYKEYEDLKSGKISVMDILK